MESPPIQQAGTADTIANPPEIGGWTLTSMYTLAMLTIAYAFNYFDRLLISLLFPLIQKDIGISDTQLGLLTGVVFVLVYSFMGIPISRLADRGNRKVIIGIGFSFWSAMTLLTGFVSNFWQMAATRFMMGAGEAAGTPTSTSMLTDLFNPKKRPVAFSILVSGTSISSLIFTPAAGWIAHLYGWRVAYLVAGGVGLFFGLVLLLTVKNPERRQYETNEDEVAHQAQKPPMRDAIMFLLRQRTYVYTTLAASLLIISFLAYIIWGTTFMLRVHKLDVAQSASLLGPIRGIFGLAGGLSAGPLLAMLMRRNRQWQVWLPSICFVVVGLAQYIFLFSSSIPMLAVGAAFDSFAVTMAVPLISLLLIQVLPSSIRAFGMASYFLVNSLLGDIMGPLAVGMMNDHFHSIWGDEAIRYSLSITAFIAIIAGPVLWLGGRQLEQDAEVARRW